MLAILSALSGFVSSLLPEVVGMVRESAQHKREMERMDKQAQIAAIQAQAEKDKADADADARVFVAAQETARAEVVAAKDSWIAAYSASVRPTVTYGFFLMFVAVEVYLMHVALKSMPAVPMPWHVRDAASLVWGEEQSALFSYIMGYWFGQRSARRRK